MRRDDAVGQVPGERKNSTTKRRAAEDQQCTSGAGCPRSPARRCCPRRLPAYNRPLSAVLVDQAVSARRSSFPLVQDLLARKLGQRTPHSKAETSAVSTFSTRTVRRPTPPSRRWTAPACGGLADGRSRGRPAAKALGSAPSLLRPGHRPPHIDLQHLAGFRSVNVPVAGHDRSTQKVPNSSSTSTDRDRRDDLSPGLLKHRHTSARSPRPARP